MSELRNNINYKKKSLDTKHTNHFYSLVDKLLMHVHFKTRVIKHTRVDRFYQFLDMGWYTRIHHQYGHQTENSIN